MGRKLFGGSVVGVLMVAALLALGQTASASPIVWTDWTSATLGNPGSASGTLGSVSVTYTGEVASPTITGPSLFNYWSPAAPYLSPTIDNAPPASDIITLVGGPGTGTNMLTFSRPLVNPVMAIVSQGQFGLPVSYTFSVPFQKLSHADGYWSGTCTVASLCSTFGPDSGLVLTAVEGHGAIQFLGTHSSISWTATPSEFWHGFQVGEPVPEPGTLLLLGGGISALALRRRRKS